MEEKAKLTVIEYTNAEILAMGAVLPELIKLDVPARVGIKIQRLVVDINKEYVLIKGHLDDLIRKYGEKTGEGNEAKYTVSPDMEKWPEYVKERIDLLGDVITRANWTPVTLPANTEHVSAALLMVMERLISVEE